METRRARDQRGARRRRGIGARRRRRARGGRRVSSEGGVGVAGNRLRARGDRDAPRARSRRWRRVGCRSRPRRCVASFGRRTVVARRSRRSSRTRRRRRARARRRPSRPPRRVARALRTSEAPGRRRHRHGADGRGRRRFQTNAEVLRALAATPPPALVLEHRTLSKCAGAAEEMIELARKSERRTRGRDGSETGRTDRNDARADGRARGGGGRRRRRALRADGSGRAGRRRDRGSSPRFDSPDERPRRVDSPWRNPTCRAAPRRRDFVLARAYGPRDGAEVARRETGNRPGRGGDSVRPVRRFARRGSRARLVRLQTTRTPRHGAPLRRRGLVAAFVERPDSIRFASSPRVGSAWTNATCARTIARGQGVGVRDAVRLGTREVRRRRARRNRRRTSRWTRFENPSRGGGVAREGGARGGGARTARGVHARRATTVPPGVGGRGTRTRGGRAPRRQHRVSGIRRDLVKRAMTTCTRVSTGEKTNGVDEGDAAEDASTWARFARGSVGWCCRCTTNCSSR